MALKYNIPSLPSGVFGFQYPCDSACKSLSQPSSAIEDGFLSISYTSSLNASSYSVSACFRNDGSLVVSYDRSDNFSGAYVLHYLIEGNLNRDTFVVDRSLFFNSYRYTSFTDAQSQAIGCSLVPVSELDRPIVTPDDDYIFSASSLVLPATILASLFFVFIYKMFKRVLF